MKLGNLLFVLCWLGAGVHTAWAGDGRWSSNGPYGGSTIRLRIDPGNPFTMYTMTMGGLFRTEDGGTSWTRIEHGIPNPVSGYAFALDQDAPSNLYVVDDAGLLYHSADRGDNWTPTGFRVPGPLIAYDLVDAPGNIGTLMLAMTSFEQYVFPDPGVMVLRSTDDGASFAPASGIPGGMGFINITFDPADPAIVLAGTDYLLPTPAPPVSPNVLFRSSDGGQNFVSVYAPAANPGYIPSVVGISFGAGSRVYAGVDSDGLIRSDDNGQTWTVAGALALSMVADPTQADVLYLSQWDGFGISTDGGATVTLHNTGLAANASFIDPATAQPLSVRAMHLVPSPGFPAAGSSLWLASFGAGIFRSTDLGLNWSNANLQQGLAAVGLRAIAIHPNPSTVGLGGNGRRLYAGFSDAHFTTPGVFVSTDGGGSWLPGNSGLHLPTVRALRFDPLRVGSTSGDIANSVLYASGKAPSGSAQARHAGIVRSTNGGLSWVRIDGDLPRRGSAPNDYTDLGTVRDIQLDPRSCTIPLSPSHCTSGTLKRMVATSNGHRVSLGGGAYRYTHRLIRSDDIDATSIHPVRQTPDVHWSDISGDLPESSYSPTLRRVLTPLNVRISPSNPDRLYVGTYKDFVDLDPNDATPLPDVSTGVFRSDDGGATWIPVSNGLPRRPGFANVVFDVFALEMHPSNPDILWASVMEPSVPNSASVYRTIDGGATWVDTSAGIGARLDIRTIVVDQGDPSIVYAAGVGTASNPGSVYRSDDGGSTWRSISIGLPSAAATALAVDPFNPSVLHAATNTGVWSLTQVPDGDGDGIPDSEENNVLNGDGNGDGTQDAVQRDIGSTGVIFRGGHQVTNTGQMTSDIRTELSTPTEIGGCNQAVDVQRAYAVQFGRDFVGDRGDYLRYPRELSRFEILHCSHAVVDLIYHGSDFVTEYGWSFRFRGPATPGDDASFGWFDFSVRAQLLAPTVNTWRLTLDANQFGSYRGNPDSILFMGGPACNDDRLLDDGFEGTPTARPSCL